jgi:sugar phosphate isomerase/epimerase
MGVQNNYPDQPNRFRIKKPGGNFAVRYGVAMSPHPSVFAPLLYAGKLNEGIEALAGAGFDAVEISLRQAEELDANWLEKRLTELELCVSAFATGRMCLEDSLCLSSTNPDIPMQVTERLVELIKLAAHFNASVIIGGVRGKLSSEIVKKAQQRTVAINTIRRCARVAQDSGVTLLLEPINRGETNFINTSLDGLAFIKEIDHPSVRLLLDAYHMTLEGEDPCAAIRHASDRLGYIHFADTDRLPPGQGQIDFAAIMTTLADIGYSGFITAEILPTPDDATALAQTGKYFDSLTSLSISNQ